jgi:hypothetical protein
MDRKRLVTYSEPPVDVPILNTNLRDLTGGADWNASGKYSTKTKVINHATHICDNNQLPIMSDPCITAEVERLLTATTPTTFVKADDPRIVSSPALFKVVRPELKLKSFIEEHRMAFIHYLLTFHKQWMGNNRVIQSTVKSDFATAAYLDSCDVTLTTLGRMYIFTDNQLDMVPINDFHATVLSQCNVMQKKQQRYAALNEIIKTLEGHITYKNHYKKMFRPTGKDGKQTTHRRVIINCRFRTDEDEE